MLKTGRNYLDGVPVDVERKRIRRINIRIGPDGTVRLSVPTWRATIAEGEAFLRSKWKWAMAARSKMLSVPDTIRRPPSPDETYRLSAVLGELNGQWAVRLGEPDVTWRLRAMKTMWGSCHFRKRHITYNTELAHAPRELVEYVVVHELTHLKAHDHGPNFQALMDARLPDWRSLRRRLATRDFARLTTEPER
jgi:predicted metal-dependent hydrolase